MLIFCRTAYSSAALLYLQLLLENLIKILKFFFHTNLYFSIVFLLETFIIVDSDEMLLFRIILQLNGKDFRVVAPSKGEIQKCT